MVAMAAAYLIFRLMRAPVTEVAKEIQEGHDNG
jgi:hypothetical protein